MWMTQPSDRYVGGRKISWVNKPKGLTVRCYRQAHPLGPHSFWKAVIIYYTGAHRAPFEWAWSPVWRRNDCYLAGQSNGVIIISHQEWSSKWKREGWHEGFLYCLFQTHTGLCQHISFWYAQIALSHTWPESPLGLSYVECISFSKLISKYSFLTAFFTSLPKYKEFSWKCLQIINIWDRSRQRLSLYCQNCLANSSTLDEL